METKEALEKMIGKTIAEVFFLDCEQGDGLGDSEVIITFTDNTKIILTSSGWAEMVGSDGSTIDAAWKE